MNDIASRLDVYPALTPEERRNIDAYVAAHPEWADRLGAARDLAALLEAAPAPPDLARHVVDERMGLPTDPATDAALAADPVLRAEADRIRDRLDALVAEAEDPVAKFERLTGRRLGDVPAPPRGSLTVAAGRPATTRRAPRRLLRWIATAAVVTGVAYGGLYAASASSLSDRERLADLGDLSSYRPMDAQGDAAGALATRLDTTLNTVDGAERSTLGLFPHYDAEALSTVPERLEAIIAEADARSPVSQEARLALGRIRFAQERDAEAARVLGSLVREGSYRGPEARRLLDAIRAGV